MGEYDPIPRVWDQGGRPQATGARWWMEPAASIGPAMVEAARKIEETPAERGRRRACLIFARLTSGRPISSIYNFGSSFSTPYVGDPWGFGWKLPLNVIQAVVEAIASRIAKNKPRGQVQTIGGDATLQRQAKGLTKYLDGLNREQKRHKVGRLVFRDSGTFGTGIFVPAEDTKKATITIERALPTEYIIDDMEASRGTPQTIFRKIPVYRGCVMDLFGKNAETKKIIEDAVGYNPGGMDGRVSEMLPVYTGIHLNGKRVISLAEGLLHQEDWEFDWHPEVFHHWRAPVSGFWGQGACENLLGVQYEIHQMLARFQAAMKLGAKLWVFRAPTGPTKAQMTNESMTIIDAESPPTFANHDPMPAQAYTYMWDLWAKSFELEGVSQELATGIKPAGLDSAPAQREYNDIQTQRFSLMGQEWEETHVDLDDKIIQLSKRMLGRGKSIKVRAPDTKTITEIDFAKVNMPENRSIVAVFPSSSLPTTPAARLQTVKEYYESGLIPDRETALSLLDMPDMESALSLQLAAIDDIKRIIENIVEDGEYESPEPYMNLELALRMVQSAYLRARNDGVPEKRRYLLLQFIDELTEVIKEMQPPPAPAPAPVAMAPIQQPGLGPEAMLPPPGAPPAPVAPPPPGAAPPAVMQ